MSKEIAVGGGAFGCTGGNKSYLYFSNEGDLVLRITVNNSNTYIAFKKDGIYVGNTKKVSW